MDKDYHYQKHQLIKVLDKNKIYNFIIVSILVLDILDLIIKLKINSMLEIIFMIIKELIVLIIPYLYHNNLLFINNIIIKLIKCWLIKLELQLFQKFKMIKYKNRIYFQT